MSSSNRKRLRLENYDYNTDGAYFVTICTKNKENLLCKIESPLAPGDDPVISFTALGEIVDAATQKIPGIDKYSIMPNHVHMIVLQEGGKNLSTTIRLWKSVITAKAKRAIWQTSFYEHVIRDEQDYLIKWKYIDDNPFKWASDEYYSSEE